MLLIFQAITLEGWVDIMYNLMDSNITIVAALYFCLLVLFGSLFLLNLILAVIMDAFDKVANKQTLEQEAEKKKHQQEIERSLKEEEERKAAEEIARQEEIA